MKTIGYPIGLSVEEHDEGREYNASGKAFLVLSDDSHLDRLSALHVGVECQLRDW